MAHAHPPVYAVPLTLCFRLSVFPWPVRRRPLTCGGSSVHGTADLRMGYTNDMRTQNALRWCPAVLSETRPPCHHHHPNLGILDLGVPSVRFCRFSKTESRVVHDLAQTRRYKHIGCLVCGSCKPLTKTPRGLDSDFLLFVFPLTSSIRHSSSQVEVATTVVRGCALREGVRHGRGGEITVLEVNSSFRCNKLDPLYLRDCSPRRNKLKRGQVSSTCCGTLLRSFWWTGLLSIPGRYSSFHGLGYAGQNGPMTGLP